MTTSDVPTWALARRLVLRLACLLIGVNALFYARYFLLYGPGKVPFDLADLFFFALLFLNLYLGLRWARWILIAIGCVMTLSSVAPAIDASRRQLGVAFLIGLWDATYLFVAWKLLRSPELNRFLAAPDRQAPVRLVRVVGVVSYSLASSLLAAAVEELPPLSGCLSASVCSRAANIVGIAVLVVYLASLPVIIVAGWSGRLPGYSGRSH